jgi:hypothetical protein
MEKKSFINLIYNFKILTIKGPPCPKGMVSLLGQCLGVVKNSRGNNATDENCYWKSGDKNYQLHKLKDDKVIVFN